MSTLKALIVSASLAASTSVVAAPNHLTDVQYMQASRCRALIASPALGKGDTTVIDGLLKSEARGRMGYVYERADEMQHDAARIARDASAERKVSLIAERNGVCEAFNGGTSTAAAAHLVGSD